MDAFEKPCNPYNYGISRKADAIKWLVVHYTSNLGDTAKNNADYFAREKLSYKASAHYFVDENEVWASVPETAIAYHVGAKSYRHPSCRNANSIGIEICMLDKFGVLRKQSIQNAVKLTRQLMEKYSIDAAHVLRHYDVTGKDCPAPMVVNPELWNEFLELLKEDDEVKRYRTYEDCPEWAKPTISKLVRLGLLKGDENSTLDLSEDMLRIFVINDRAGLYH